MAEKEGLETSHALTDATTGFQDRPLAFRVTSPCKFLAEAGCLANPREVSPATRDFRGHSLAFRVTLPVEIENGTAFLLHRVMNLGCHGLADYSVRGWQHLPEVLRTGFFSASNVTIFRL